MMMIKTSRVALGSHVPPIQWVLGVLSPGVKQPGYEADHSPKSNAEAKGMELWLYSPYRPSRHAHRQLYLSSEHNYQMYHTVYRYWTQMYHTVYRYWTLHEGCHKLPDVCGHSPIHWKNESTCPVPWMTGMITHGIWCRNSTGLQCMLTHLFPLHYY